MKKKRRPILFDIDNISTMGIIGTGEYPKFRERIRAYRVYMSMNQKGISGIFERFILISKNEIMSLFRRSQHAPLTPTEKQAEEFDAWQRVMDA